VFAAASFTRRAAVIRLGAPAEFARCRDTLPSNSSPESSAEVDEDESQFFFRFFDLADPL